MLKNRTSKKITKVTHKYITISFRIKKTVEKPLIHTK